MVWDSGVVPSNASNLIVFGGPAGLPSDTDLAWTVSLNLAGVGLVTAGDVFSTAPAAPLPGAWLGFADTLRASVVLSDAPVTRARLHATGVGCYVLYINGVRISPDLSPGFAHA